MIARLSGACSALFFLSACTGAMQQYKVVDIVWYQTSVDPVTDENMYALAKKGCRNNDEQTRLQGKVILDCPYKIVVPK